MEALRKFINILVLLFLVFALLVLLNIISTPYLDETFTNFSPEQYYRTIFGITAGFLLVYLLVSNMSILALKRERNVLSNKVNELKANLYDKKVGDAREQSRENRPMQTGNSHPEPIFPPDNLQ